MSDKDAGPRKFVTETRMVLNSFLSRGDIVPHEVHRVQEVVECMKNNAQKIAAALAENRRRGVNITGADTTAQLLKEQKEFVTRLLLFPALRRRHVGKPAARIEWMSPDAAPSINTLKESTPSLPQRTSRRESLRSTWLTTASDSMADNDQELDQTVIPEDQCSERQPFVQLHRPLRDWVYWQREVVARPTCWTRVFAVFCGNL
ncbi:hypothetical protein PsorP6_013788 [Peronosclerospora sorghi]|uniref:Uncharacterized protein n=1 Tax=Peronosclerospora sorghi TaxID=230839 RepID=A0ACC0VFN5_9STRA|nr:hypothetical protein PsorP6_013788 [Peronosclerospora sorghi]